MRVGDKIAPLHHPILKPANLPDFLAVARINRMVRAIGPLPPVRSLATIGRAASSNRRQDNHSGKC
jgi:hypothetical protein